MTHEIQIFSRKCVSLVMWCLKMLKQVAAKYLIFCLESFGPAILRLVTQFEGCHPANDFHQENFSAKIDVRI